MSHTTPRSAVRMLVVLALLIGLAVVPVHAAETFTPARVAVYFSPHGGATDAVVHELTAAKTQVLMQAYAFTSAPIAKALVEAHKRGVQILAVLDTSNETGQYSAATFLTNTGLEPRIDDAHAIAHSKVMVIDRATIITGSFNFTKAAEEKNAENLLVITEAPELVTAYEANIRFHAEHAHPYRRQAAAGSSGTGPVTGSGNGGWGPSIACIHRLRRDGGRLLIEPIMKVWRHPIAQQLLHSPYVIRYTCCHGRRDWLPPLG